LISLVGFESQLLLDHNQLVAVNQEGVIVLQTNESMVAVPYFNGDREVYLYPRNPTRNIIAGLSKVLGGLVEPWNRFSSLHNRVEVDYSWALGHHPYGPFSNISSVSQIFLDTIIRNAVISGINSAIVVVKEAVGQIDHFAKDYLVSPFGNDTSHAASASAWKNWIDYLYHNPSVASTTSPIATTTVYQLHQELKHLETQLGHIASLLYNYRLEEAYKMTSLLRHKALAFKTHVDNEIDEAEMNLVCCFLDLDVMPPSILASGYLQIIIFGSVLFILAKLFRIYFGKSHVKK